MSCNAVGQPNGPVPGTEAHALAPDAPGVQGVMAAVQEERGTGTKMSLVGKKRKDIGSTREESVCTSSLVARKLGRKQLSTKKPIVESSRMKPAGCPSPGTIEQSDFVQDIGMKQPACIVKSRLTHRSNPVDIVNTIKMLSPDQREEIKKLGWGKFLEFNLQTLESRDLYCWLMDRIDLQSMELRVAHGKVFRITEQVVHVVLGVPMGGGNIPDRIYFYLLTLRPL